MHLKPIDLSITPSQFSNLFVPTEGTSRIAVFGGECINGGLPLTNIKDSIEIVSVKGNQVTISANHHANDVDGGARLSLLGVMTRGALSNPSSHELRGGLLCEASYILFPEISADLGDSLSIAMILTAAVGSVFVISKDWNSVMKVFSLVGEDHSIERRGVRIFSSSFLSKYNLRVYGTEQLFLSVFYRTR